MTTPLGRYYYYYSHFTDVETETHRGYIILLKFTKIVVTEDGVNYKTWLQKLQRNYSVIMSNKKKNISPAS